MHTVSAQPPALQPSQLLRDLSFNPNLKLNLGSSSFLSTSYAFNLRHTIFHNEDHKKSPDIVHNLPSPKLSLSLNFNLSLSLSLALSANLRLSSSLSASLSLSLSLSLCLSLCLRLCRGK